MKIKFEVDVNLNIKHSQESDLLKLLKIINQKTDKIMATQEQFESALTRIDAATTAIADQLRDLRDQITNAGLSAEVEASVLARLETAATQLEAVGQSVENPTPEIPENPEA